MQSLDEVSLSLESQAVRKEKITSLAKLSPVDYDLQRTQAASEIGCNVGALDAEVKQVQQQANQGLGESAVEELEPWDSEVSGRDLFDQIRGMLNRYMDLPNGADLAVTLWVFGSFAYDQFNVFPKLLISSPAPECGKSTLMEIIEAVSRSALLVSNASPSTIFRSVELWHPSLLLDEIDAWMRQDNDEMRGLVNAGHTRRGAFVLRTVGDDHIPTKFSVWGPMALAGINKPADTIIGRSIQVELQRMAPGVTKGKLPLTLFEDCTDLRRRLLRWEQDTNLCLIDDPTPAIGGHRQRDNWSVLLQIATAIDAECLDEAVWAFRKAVELTAKGLDASQLSQLLEDIREYIRQTSADKSIHSADLTIWLDRKEDRPWSDWKDGMTQTKLARQLKGIATPTTVKINGNAKKGYRVSHLQEGFRRYLLDAPPFQRVTPLPSADLGASGETEGVTPEEKVTARIVPQPSQTGKGNGVTSKSPGAEEEGDWDEV